jgi:Na+-transporting NADH:ubiquinone oxidoreductase subunit C
MEFTPVRTVLFAGIVCFVCSVFVATSAVGLKDRQKSNEVLDRQKKVLDVVGLLPARIAQNPSRIQAQYKALIKPVLVDLAPKGCDGQSSETFDQQKFAKDPATSRHANESEATKGNKAKVQRIPNCALVFHVRKARGSEEVKAYILPVEGKGLWSTLYGYIALEPNAIDIKGLTFYKHAETPGLGGEVDNPKWKKQWSGKKAFSSTLLTKGRYKGKKGAVLYVEKGSAKDEYSVDGLSGATLTSNGVTHLLQFWLGDNGFGPELKKYRKGGAS